MILIGSLPGDEPLEIMHYYSMPWPLFFEVGVFAMPCLLFINMIRLHTTGAYCCYFSFKSYFMIRISGWKKDSHKT